MYRPTASWALDVASKRATATVRLDGEVYTIQGTIADGPDPEFDDAIPIWVQGDQRLLKRIGRQVGAKSDDRMEEYMSILNSGLNPNSAYIVLQA